ncbi:MAG: hypothetical protein UT65_C0015G0022 [Parcubacteria group bacterium GW2011_GWF2_39_8b]|nr:MAG: hypothetical protein UT65_C0015G0022 [Parcubacteria group bacterium GW2011_GWF2_39_8b]KKR46227.1 MAG: hypothetical protein UT81_C0001G0074 [Parcubacteria group bacterium GW2011_GWA2_40_14]OHA94074.1 MAG: hypothetical protein A2W58_01110 [Candidatus Zambryskibacteria bacterium RIFCSPHIGHO2_02_38_10.5]OHA97411.1 MAG: hypothetical protein A3C63_00110 [Candidatus Zambryskibacteria bacterium RIFCSPHIGHO2_02_FULL_39_82]OHB08096.1 MAG: hypothetical protein A2W64_03115 [Candidatus Zambryskibact
MFQTKLFKQAFLLLFVVGILNLVGTELYLYWTLWWYDIILHFLSAGVVSLATIVFFRIFLGKRLSGQTLIKYAVFCALVVGIIWEIYELYFEMTYLSDGMIYVTDTVSDLIMDIAGGLLGSIYAIRLVKNNE